MRKRAQSQATATITAEQRRRRVARRHRLIPSERLNNLARLTESVVALHSSDPATVFLSLAARMKTPTVRRIENALYQKRTLVRHHAMRRTIWVMTPRFARLAHGAATARIALAEKKRTLKAFAKTKQIKNAEAWYEAAADEIRELLLDRGTMSARAIGNCLPHLAVPVQFGSEKYSAVLNAHTKVLQGEGFAAMLVRGPSTGAWTSAEYVWSDTQRWLGQAIAGVDESAAAAELLREWLASFGPATTEDIKWWFGWTASLTCKSLQAIDAETVHLDDDAEAWVLPSDVADDEETEPWLQFLPGLDATTMGWKQRDWYLDPKHTRPLFDRFGNAGPTIWADGRVVGSWIQRPDGAIVYQLLTKLGRDHRRLLDETIERTEAFLGEAVVKPRFPATIQKELLAKGKSSS
ncbi:MAG: winged helix DNA-binding domain-containing protein [Planctomycetota bacterium]